MASSTNPRIVYPYPFCEPPCTLPEPPEGKNRQVNDWHKNPFPVQVDWLINARKSLRHIDSTDKNKESTNGLNFYLKTTKTSQENSNNCNEKVESNAAYPEYITSDQLSDIDGSHDDFNLFDTNEQIISNNFNSNNELASSYYSQSNNSEAPIKFYNYNLNEENGEAQASDDLNNINNISPKIVVESMISESADSSYLTQPTTFNSYTDNSRYTSDSSFSHFEGTEISYMPCINNCAHLSAPSPILISPSGSQRNSFGSYNGSKISDASNCSILTKKHYTHQGFNGFAEVKSCPTNCHTIASVSISIYPSLPQTPCAQVKIPRPLASRF